jgi:hypothetical protein
MRLGSRPDLAAQDMQTLARVRGALEGYAATAPGKDVHVSVAHVLDLLNPRGMWSLDPQRRKQEKPEGQPPEEQFPGADPLTGCRPATAPTAD